MQTLFREKAGRVNDAPRNAHRAYTAPLPLAKEAERERRLFGLQLLHPGLGGHLLRTPKPRGRFGSPVFSICTGGVNPPGIKMFAPRSCLAAARSRSQKRRSGSGGYLAFSFSIPALAAICSASFLLRPFPWPMGWPLRSTSTEKILAWSGPSEPMS